MTPAGVAALTAVNTEPHLDPDNPAALGYAPASPELAAVRASAAADPEVAAALCAQLRRETARFRAWVERRRRRGAGGCGWSLTGSGFTPTPPEALLEQARAVTARRRAWAGSRAGQLSARLGQAEATAAGLARSLAEMRALIARGGAVADGAVERSATVQSLIVERRAAASATSPRLREEG